LASRRAVGDADGFARTAQQLFTTGYEIAERAALDWLAHVRVASGQPWLGLAVEAPAQYGRGHIFDADADVRLMSFGPTQRATMRAKVEPSRAELLTLVLAQKLESRAVARCTNASSARVVTQGGRPRTL
jgi:hypothetical protein